MRISLSKNPLVLLLVACLLTTITTTTAFSYSGDPSDESRNERYLSRELLITFVRVDGQVSPNEIDRQVAELDAFVAQLRHKREKYRSEQRFLSYFFYKVHRRFLKRYQSHTTMRDLLEDGHYDCVTGSALYALLLDALDIPYQVHEFPYHVYLTVTPKDQDTIMIESTDPQYGLVIDTDEQAKRYRHYRQVSDTDAYYQYDFTIQEDIGLTELAGLSYFNEAVEYYNKRELQQAKRLLQQATRLYASPRTAAFEALMASISQK